MSKAKELTLTFFSDPGHEWLKVPCKLIEAFGITANISGCSYLNGEHAYLEGDRDAGIFARAAQASGYTLKIRSAVAKERESRIRTYADYSADSCKERASRPKPAAGLFAEFGGVTYELKRNLGRKGWEVERTDGIIFRLTAAQLAKAVLRHP